jgi:SAM-dependent methyltransferase
MNLFSPQGDWETFSMEDVHKFLANIRTELGILKFTEDEKDYLGRRIYTRYFNDKERPFFEYHFEPLIYKGVSELFKGDQAPKILDIGCGTGMMSLLFALLGARVIGVDLDPLAMSICQKRKELYEENFGSLDIEFYKADIFQFPFEKEAPFDGIYSLFAFNLMQPTRDLLRQCISSLNMGGKFVISDGNVSSIYRFFSSQEGVLSPSKISDECRKNGCEISDLAIGCLFPPSVVQRSIAFRAIRSFEPLLEKIGLIPYLGLSYTLAAKKTQSTGRF